MELSGELFGYTPAGEKVYIFTMRNNNGIVVKITNFGGIVTSLLVPDRQDQFADVVLGFDNLEGYLGGHPYFGALVGRYANRIGNAAFEIDGELYRLSANEGKNQLHGGNRGFDKIVWECSTDENNSSPSLVLSCLSPHGSEGYPGNLSAVVVYSLTDRDELVIRYNVKTDRPTHVNLSHHGYFNLSGGKEAVLGHELMVNASRYTATDDQLIPTGELAGVEGTPLDFRKIKPVGKDISLINGGYDNNYVLDKDDQGGIAGPYKNNSPDALLYEPVSGRTVELYTTQPGLQVYTGNFLDGSIRGKDNIVYDRHWGICLEAQHFPDSPNKPGFPSTLLKPGDTYRHTTIYRFYSK